MEAVKYFKEGYNCAQSVFVPFALNYLKDEKLALKLMSPFGGGVSNTDNICGAVSGGLAALGLKFGHSEADDLEGKMAAKKTAQEFMLAFEKEHGSISCSTLIGYNLSQSYQQEKAKKAGVFDTICPKLVETAEKLVSQIFKEL